jgi:hypothetical protein
MRANDAPMAANHAAERQSHFFRKHDDEVDFAAYFKTSVGEKEKPPVRDVFRGRSEAVPTRIDGSRSLKANPLLAASFFEIGVGQGVFPFAPHIRIHDGAEFMMSQTSDGQMKRAATLVMV